MRHRALVSSAIVLLVAGIEAEPATGFDPAEAAMAPLSARKSSQEARNAAAPWLKKHPGNALAVLLPIIGLYRVPRRKPQPYFYNVRDVLTSLAPTMAYTKWRAMSQ